MAVELTAATMAYMALASAAISTGAAMYAQDQSTKAANAESKYREQLLTRRAGSEREALRENSRRRMIDRDRQLSEIRARQAAAGFANSGTQLAVFGEIRSRMDDEIDSATNQGLNQLANYSDQISMSKFATSQRNAAHSTNMLSTAVQGATGAASGYRDNYRHTGQDPFSIFN